MPGCSSHSRVAVFRCAARCGICITVALGLLSTLSPAATDPRVVERYRQMVEANPMEANALDRLWKIAQQEGFSEKLLDEYRDRSAKGDFQSQMIWAQLFHRAGRDDESREAFAHASTLNAKSELPHLALAALLEPADRAVELERAVELMPPGAPSLPDVLRQLGESWMAGGQPDKAAVAWEKIVALAPNDAELRQRLATLYADKGMAPRAAAHYSWLEKHGDSATRVNALRALSRLYQASDDDGPALDALEKALALTAADNWLRGEIVSEMIRLSQQANRVADLEARWKKAADADPRATAPWIQLAELYARQGALKEERAALESYLSLVPDDFERKARLARLLVRLDDLTGAAAQFDALLALQPRNAGLVFERAELDVRVGQPGAARARIEALEAQPTPPGAAHDEQLASRATEFFTTHRMFDAIEDRLRKPGTDPAALADFLFSQHRTEEARVALHGLLRFGDSPKAQAAARERAAELLKQAGDVSGAIAELREGVRIEPGSRRMQLAFGDLLLMDAKAEEAGKAFQTAFTLSQTDEERAETDQRLFRSLSGIATPPPGNGKLPAPSDDSQNPAVQKFIVTLEEQARGSRDSQAWLRVARWQFWCRELQAAQAAASQAITLAPEAPAPRELAVSIATAAGDRTTTLVQLRQLAQVVPSRKEAFLKQMAQVQLQMGMTDEALTILADLARSNSPAALVDLANGQQQADQWLDALATWERLYQQAGRAHRQEFLAPLIRAMQHLDMDQRAAELLWQAFGEEAEDSRTSARDGILRDLIAHCKEHELMPWLLDKLQARSLASPSGAQALAKALKAAGQLEEAYKQLQISAVSAPDRAAAEEELVKEAETLRDFAQAARHQQLRLTLLPVASAAEWERLADLQESALDYSSADRTRAEIPRRFPRDSDALLRCARYFESWGEPERALALMRSIRQIDSGNVSAAAGIMRLIPIDPVPTEVREAAETVLARTLPGTPSDPLVLPPTDPWSNTRVQGCLGALGGTGVSVLDDNTPSATEREWRLQAIRLLAENLDDAGRNAWLETWKGSPSPSEKLWALYFAGAQREVFAHLLDFAAKAPRNPARSFALIWSALRSENLEPLAAWLWAPERSADDQEAFRLALVQGEPLGEKLETLFEKAPAEQLWSCAEVLANEHRIEEAVALGRQAFDNSPAPHEDHGLALASWMLAKGDTSGVRAFLRILGSEAADSLDAPTYAAQRALFLLTPENERPQLVQETLAAQDPASPLHSALTAALLHSLSGNTAASHEALSKLVALRAAPGTETSNIERAWEFLLTAGQQLQLFHLEDAALFFWERALADGAAIHLQGQRAEEFAGEIRLRVAAIQLTRTKPGEFSQALEKLSKNTSASGLTQLAAFLQEGGFCAEAVRVLDFVQRRQPATPLSPLLAACAAAKDDFTAQAAIARWKAHGFEEIESLPAALDFVGTRDPARALELAEALAAKRPEDSRVLDPLARRQSALGKWSQAEQTLKRLLAAQPDNTEFRLALVNALSAQNRHRAALDVIKAAPRRSPELEAVNAELLVASGSFSQAQILAGDILRGNDSAPTLRLAKAFIAAKRPVDGLSLLNSAVDASSESGKSRAAFTLQRQLLELSGTAAQSKPRLLRRLRVLAANRPDLLSIYYELTADSQWQPRDVRQRELLADWDTGHGAPVAGAWLIGELLDAGDPEAAGKVLPALLLRKDTPDALLTWLDERFKRANRHALALTISETLLARVPDNTDYAIRRARSLHALGRNDEMTALLGRAALRSVFVPDLAGRIGLVALELGSTDLARKILGE